MLEEGVASAADIDRAMELGYNHPMGPLKLTDLVGLDVRLAIAEHLNRELGGFRFQPPQLLKRLVRAGKLGRKSGEGFYKYGVPRGKLYFLPSAPEGWSPARIARGLFGGGRCAFALAAASRSKIRSKTPRAKGISWIGCARSRGHRPAAWARAALIGLAAPREELGRIEQARCIELSAIGREIVRGRSIQLVAQLRESLRAVDQQRAQQHLLEFLAHRQDHLLRRNIAAKCGGLEKRHRLAESRARIGGLSGDARSVGPILAGRAANGQSRGCGRRRRWPGSPPPRPSAGRLPPPAGSRGAARASPGSARP